MTNKIINDSDVELLDNIFVYDKFAYYFSKKISKIKSVLHRDKNNKINQIFLNVYNKFKKVFALDFVIINETLNHDTMLLRLEKEANNYKIRTLEWSKGDDFFKHFKITDIKNHGNNILKTLKIILTDPVEYVLDEEKKRKIMEIYHNDPVVGGHSGIKKLYAKLRTKYYWKNMPKDIAKFGKQCNSCILNKVRPGNLEPLVITPTPIRPFDIVIIDTIGPLPMSGYGKKFALTLMCDLTKYLITIAIPDKSAKTVAGAIFENFSLIYGTMKSIRSDLGTEFKNEIFEELCKLLRITHNFSTPHHHETVATVERSHRVFNEYLRAYIDESFADWDIYLKYFTFLHNTSTNSVFDNNFTPYELLFGKKSVLPTQIELNTVEPIYNIENYAKEVKYRLQKSHELAKNLIQKHKEKNKKLYDQKARPLILSVDDMVLVKREPYDKYKNIYDGPFRITHIDNTNVTMLDENKKKEYIVHKNRVRKLK